MNLCRFQTAGGTPRAGALCDDGAILDLGAAGIKSLTEVLEADDPRGRIESLYQLTLPLVPASKASLLPPVERQEVWAAGVTYQRSKLARMEESEFSASAYDRVYNAPRPELFFKALAEKAVGPGDTVGIRRDARWNVPEPELALIINSRRQLVGYTIGNDMSSRDIEGENLLYLPQAKTYLRSCALGPRIILGVPEAQAREWSIQIAIERAGQTVFSGETSVGRIKRSFDELIEYLFRSQVFPNGVVLLTGTGVVPPDDFTLAADDRVRIQISGIGTLENRVVVV